MLETASKSIHWRRGFICFGRGLQCPSIECELRAVVYWFYRATLHIAQCEPSSGVRPSVCLSVNHIRVLCRYSWVYRRPGNIFLVSRSHPALQILSGTGTPQHGRQVRGEYIGKISSFRPIHRSRKRCKRRP